MAQGNGENATKGANIVVGGLVVQLLFFVTFLVVSIHLDLALRKRPTLKSKLPDSPWYKHLIALYAASILILIRNLFRVVEYVQGNDGYLLGHEWFLYIFDAVLMLTVMVIFNVVHPSEVKAMLKGGQYLKNAVRLNTFTGSQV